MAEDSDLNLIRNVSLEVDEVQFKILETTANIKARSFLKDKIKNENQRRKELCSYICSADLKLMIEIKSAESEFNSLTAALQTIISANVEYRKELLLIKERRSEIEERVRNENKKYEDLWMVSKAKYENLPLIKSNLEAKNICQIIQESINILKNEHDKLRIYKMNKKWELKNLDMQRVLKLAEYFIERPKSLKIILDEENQRNKLKEAIQDLEKCNIKNDAVVDTRLLQKLEASKNTKPDLQNNLDNKSGLALIQMQLHSIDLDIISVKLNQVKKESSMPINRMDTLVTKDKGNRKRKAEQPINDEYNISNYFNIGVYKATDTDDKNKKDFSDKKLIHILEDITLDKNDAYKVVASINRNNLQSVNVIKFRNNDQINLTDLSQNKLIKEHEPNDIEEIDLTVEDMPNVLPPTQFMDCSQGKQYEFSKENLVSGFKDKTSNKLSQESKKVTFDIKESQDDNIQASENQLNTSHEGFTHMKEMILKKHNLDLSPQFVYTKNTYQPNSVKDPPTKDNVVTSKFFDKSNVAKTEDIIENLKVKTNEGQVNVTDDTVSKTNDLPEKDQYTNIQESTNMPQNCSSPKGGQDMTIAGLLFTPSAQNIPDSLNLSMSTAEYEEGDSNFQHGIDSSLLLSPQADNIASPNKENNNDPNSQGIPSFLAGLRKPGLLLFGAKPDDVKPDSNAENQGNHFTFSFSGEDKRNRGGFFSMFR